MMMFLSANLITLFASTLTETDIVNLLSALLTSIIDVLANSDSTAVVFALTGA